MPYPPWGTDKTGIYVEGVGGYASAKQSVGDIYSGAIPGLETSVNSDLKTYGGLVGVGPEFRLSDGLTFAPIVNGGVARIENDAQEFASRLPLLTLRSDVVIVTDDE